MYIDFFLSTNKVTEVLYLISLLRGNRFSYNIRLSTSTIYNQISASPQPQLSVFRFYTIILFICLSHKLQQRYLSPQRNARSAYSFISYISYCRFQCALFPVRLTPFIPRIHTHCLILPFLSMQKLHRVLKFILRLVQL